MKRGEEWAYEGRKEPGREGSVRTSRDATGINADKRAPIDSRMPTSAAGLGEHDDRRTGRDALAGLRRFVRAPREAAEVCELCAKPVAPAHQHLLELDKQRVTCACDACAILFGGNARQRYRRIPRDVRRLHNFQMDDHEWESLLIPINLAFFVNSRVAGRVVARYPSPGGAMESALDFEYWNDVVERNPVLRQFEPDVEALLVNRSPNG